ncbi:MAG: TIGR02587 family membrane protein [Leptolyngbya sp. ERB_1_1]
MLTHLGKQWKTELTDLVRGASGGFLLGIPLLYTMEVWWIGSYISPFRMLFALVLTFLIVFLLNQTSGFRNGNAVKTIDALKDAIEALAIGLVCSGVTLILLQEITFNTPLIEALGKLIYESVPFTFGVALANQFLGKDQSRSGDDQPKRKGNATLSDISATLIGALVIAFNIAPTDEIPMLASAVTGGWLLAMIPASLLVSYCIVFAAGFTNQQQRYQHQGVFQRPWGETIAAYLVSLFAAMLMLAFFQKLHFDDPWQIWLSYTILLGLPAAVGGAAGRLAA